ncbi:hypothetical protein AB0I28_12290 [Phytomonospora sp. NPDC050363]|uniref:hypothetical protein n=1 Tax=Phytomonospora sp. NPDC050363 TaxID=3155642 RepID=UPI00340B4C47
MDDLLNGVTSWYGTAMWQWLGDHAGWVLVFSIGTAILGVGLVGMFSRRPIEADVSDYTEDGES